MKRKKMLSFGGLIILLGVTLFSHNTQVNAEPNWPGWDMNTESEWNEVTDILGTGSSINSYLYDPSTTTTINKAKAYVSTTLAPGGDRKGTTNPSADVYYTRRRTDIPFLQFGPRTLNNLAPNFGAHKRTSVGRNTDLYQSGAITLAWQLNLKSLGLVFAVENDTDTIQEASMGRVTPYDLSPSEPTIDRSTFRIYTKTVSRVNVVNGGIFKALRYVYEVNIKDKQANSYRVQVNQTYYPSKNGQIRISFDVKNIGDKPIPQLMIGYNYTPEVSFTLYNNEVTTGKTEFGQVKYLGRNLGIYAVDPTGVYRAEFYPTIDRDGADSWSVWAEPFVGKAGMGSRDSTVFMKGFDDPNDLFSAGQEHKGVIKDTVILDDPKGGSEGGSDTTISMKWNPQDLPVGETRNAAWIYGSEIKDINPRLLILDDDRKYALTKNGNSNVLLKGTWRSYMAESGTIKYRVDDGDEQELSVSYDTPDDVGGIELFEIPFTFEPTKDHTITLFMEDGAGNRNETQTVTYTFDYPEPKIVGTSAIKVKDKIASKIAVGGEFTYNMELAMQTPYSKLFGNKVSIPINTAIVDDLSLKDITITDGLKVVKGTYNSAAKTLTFTFDDDLLEDSTLRVQFTGKIIDSESLIGETLAITPSEVIGKSGVATDFKDFSMPTEELPQTTATIVSKISAINVRYLIEGTTTSLGEIEPPKEGLTGSSDTISAKAFTGYLLSKISIDGAEQDPLTNPVPVEYGEVEEVTFYYQVRPILKADLAISLPEISEGEKVTFTSTIKNLAAAPSDLTDLVYETTEAFPENVNVDLTSIELNGQPLAADAVSFDAARKLKVNLDELEPGIEYSLTYDVVSEISTPPLAKALVVKQAYTLSGKSADGATVTGDSGVLTAFTIKPRIAAITVLHLEEETEAELAKEQPKQGIIGDETTFTAKEINGFILSKVVIDGKEQPLSSVVKVKYGEHSSITFYYKGVLEFSSVPSALNFGTKAMDGNEIRVNQPSYDAPLVVSDSRSDKKSWTLKAKMTTPLTNTNGKIIVGAIRYKSPGKEEFPLNDGTQALLTASNTATYDVSATWGALKDSPGFKFELPAVKVKELGKYRGIIEYSLEDTYKP